MKRLGMDKFHGPVLEQLGRIAEKRLNHLSRIHQIADQLFGLNGWFPVKVLEKSVFFHQGDIDPFRESILIKKIRSLNPDFHILVCVERGDPRFGGSEFVFPKPLLFIFIEKDVIGENDLSPVGDAKGSFRYPPADYLLPLLEKGIDVQGDPCA
jgi:hypothetical protein